MRLRGQMGVKKAALAELSGIVQGRRSLAANMTMLCLADILGGDPSIIPTVTGRDHVSHPYIHPQTCGKQLQGGSF